MFGCTCFVYIPKHQRDKLDPKAVKCIFVGYPSSQKGYKCYVPGDKGLLFVTMDVSLHGDIPFFSSVSKELLPEGSAQENVPLVDSVSPPFLGSSHGEGMDSPAPEGGEQLQGPLQVYSGMTKGDRPLLPIPSSDASNPDPNPSSSSLSKVVPK